MHDAQRIEAVRALDTALLQVYPALLAVRRANPQKLQQEAESFKDGLRLAADALNGLFDSTPMRVLRFVLRDQAELDLPGAVVGLRDVLQRVSAAGEVTASEIDAAWHSFVARLGELRIVVDEIPVGAAFDPTRHDAVAGTSGKDNGTVREVLTPGLAVCGTRVAWARVRTGPKLLA